MLTILVVKSMLVNLLEPITVLNDVILAKNMQKCRKMKSVKSENCDGKLVYGLVHAYQHQKFIHYITPEKKGIPHMAHVS